MPRPMLGNRLRQITEVYAKIDVFTVGCHGKARLVLGYRRRYNNYNNGTELPTA